MVDLEEKCRKLQYLIKEKKKSDTGEPTKPKALSQEDVDKWKNGITELEKEKVNDEKRYKKLLNKIQSSRKQLEHEVNILSVKLKEKD